MNQLYICIISEYQSRGNQIDLPLQIAKDFFELPNKTLSGSSNCVISILHKQNLSAAPFEIEIQPATNLRFSSKLNSFLDSNNDTLQEGDLLVFEKINRVFVVYRISRGSEQYNPIFALFDTGEKHMLLSANNYIPPKEFPLQQIWYGAPGTGKSHGVKELTDGMPDENVFRTTFHPDSDYSTFVGCYKPKKEQAVLRDMAGRAVLDPITNEEITEERITYGFEPQAFIKAYIRAYQTDEPVALVIEEINRGNCAQIFGDIFQLLDRKEGVSEYPVKPDSSLNDYLKAVLKDKYDESVGMIIPSNLHIWATMNTSDQSLFPIDSAFKRRWSWKYVPISDAKKEYAILVNNTLYDWWDFAYKVNSIIEDEESGEDKQLGYFFCKADMKNADTDTECTVISPSLFVGKVLFYLWKDVFKDSEMGQKMFDGMSAGEKLKFRHFFNPDGEVNEDVVEKLMRNLDVELANQQTKTPYDDADVTTEKRDRSRFSINGVGKMNKVDTAVNVIKEYLKLPQSQGLTGTEIYNQWDALGIQVQHLIETQEMYDKRTVGSKDANHRAKRIAISENEAIYVSTQWNKYNIMQFIEKVNAQSGWGINIQKVENI